MCPRQVFRSQPVLVPHAEDTAAQMTRRSGRWGESLGQPVVLSYHRLEEQIFLVFMLLEIFPPPSYFKVSVNSREVAKNTGRFRVPASPTGYTLSDCGI